MVIGLVVGRLLMTGKSTVALLPELPESAMSVTGGQVTMGDKFVLIVLSTATCSPPHQASGW